MVQELVEVWKVNVVCSFSLFPSSGFFWLYTRLPSISRALGIVYSVPSQLSDTERLPYVLVDIVCLIDKMCAHSRSSRPCYQPSKISGALSKKKHCGVRTWLMLCPTTTSASRAIETFKGQQGCA